MSTEQAEEGAQPSKNALKKAAKEAEKAAKSAERKARQDAEAAARAAAEVDDAVGNYGVLPLNQSQTKTGEQRVQIESLNANSEGYSVLFRARLHTSRAQGSKMVFVVFRQRQATIQGLLQVKEGAVSRQMLKWVAGITTESIVLVRGTVARPIEEVQSASVKDAEIHINTLHVVSPVETRLPFTMDDASRPEAEYEKAEKEGIQYNKVLLETRLNNRVLDLRTQTNQAIFTVEHGVCELFRSFLNSQGFTEIHTPKLQGAATESGASVFRVQYFTGLAFLAQSPQLAKQMAIAADFEKVYEIAPVFRAEDSNTHRHMTEFMGLDLEMAFEETYDEVVDLLDSLFLNIFEGLSTRYASEIALIGRQFPAEPFMWRKKDQGGTLRLRFSEGISMLRGAGADVDDLEDLSTENERWLGRLVKEKFSTDYYILDKFPMAIRPFYTMPDPEDDRYSNSYDFFMRGEEILSGAQRIHDAPLLESEMIKKGIDPASMKHYLDAFRLGCPPHGGGGIGLERVVMLFLKLNNIRRAALFPRDPKRLVP
ncbi:aspartate-tRNA ligase [Dacryopinax primogenitus]|uniref:Aspartate--tRNA ligase, cytoplasmic n=1 Tax=Dacryopinax primogenitus (strain DJM 731) TaxID=1858805 RepID=M5FUG3_DACPD|nr:aspartate-tRNA ligase [Dacryopinax primogenitus]EJT99868.1 aspartate-tRNA ligase [Dacryopinax primogenitus]